VDSEPRAVALTVVAVIAVGLNLRPALASVGPVLADVRRGLALNGAVAGALITVPTLCMAVLSLTAIPLGAKLGLERGVMVGLVAIGAATLARAWTPDAGWLLGTAALAGAGIGLIQTLLPAIVKARLPHRAIVLTAILGASINAGAIVASGAAAPIAAHWHSWRAALAIWSVAALLAAVCWAALPGATPPQDALGDRPRSVPWRIGVLAGSASFTYVVVLTWLAPALEARGYSAGSAGALLALASAAQIPAAIAAGALLSVRSDLGPHFVRWLPVTALALLGTAYGSSAVAVACIVLYGAGMGVLYALCLILPVRYASDASDVVALGAVMFGVGYLLAAAGPMLAGLVHDLSGSYAPVFVLCAAVLIAALPMSRGLQAGLTAAPQR
jgi:CP family cyanate transporter-like MFS transporter